MSEHLPVDDWDYASIGDEASPVTVEITAEKVLSYAAAQRDDNEAFRLEGGASRLRVPVLLVRVYAPLRRRELVAEKRARYPDHPTPAVHWRCEVFDELHVGEHITSVTRVHDKYVKNDRHFIKWQVEARRDADAPVAIFTYVNLWDRGRPEDSKR